MRMERLRVYIVALAMAISSGLILGCAKKEEGPVQPATGTIVGKAILEGETDHSGILISIANTPYQTITRSDGSYTLSDIPEGPATIVASKEGFSEQYAEIEIIGGKTVTVPELRLPKGAILEGKATIFGEQDHSGIMVMVEGTQLRAETSEDGSYSIAGVPPGKYTIVAKKGDLMEKVSVSVPGTGVIKVPDIELIKVFIPPPDLNVAHYQNGAKISSPNRMIPGFDLRDAIGGSFGTHAEKNTAIFADDTKEEQIAIIEFSQVTLINTIIYETGLGDPPRVPRQVVIDVSIDGVRWVNIVKAGVPTQDRTTYTFPDVKAKYVRFNFGLAGPGYQPGVIHSGSTRISEIEIYHK